MLAIGDIDVPGGRAKIRPGFVAIPVDYRNLQVKIVQERAALRPGLRGISGPVVLMTLADEQQCLVNCLDRPLDAFVERTSEISGFLLRTASSFSVIMP